MLLAILCFIISSFFYKNILGVIFFGLGVFSLTTWLLNFFIKMEIKRINSIKSNLQPKCPPHNWQYDERSELYCSVCGKIPKIE